MVSFPVTIKMMKKIITTYLVLALIGCSASNDGEDYGTENTATPIRFATGMASSVTSKGPVISNGGLVTKDLSGVQLLRDDSQTPFAAGIPESVTEATIKAEHVDNKNLMSLTEAQYFRVDRSDACFMAYYPAGDLSSGRVDYTIDGSQDILTSNQDIAKYDTKQEVSLHFKHQLVLLRLQVKVPSDEEAAAFGSLTKASINVPVGVRLSIVGTDFKLNPTFPSPMKELSFLPNNQPVELKGETLLIGELMIYPEPFNKITLAFTNKPEETYTLTWGGEANLLKAGTMNTITVNLEAFEIRFSASVSPWGEGNNGGEEITIGGASE